MCVRVCVGGRAVASAACPFMPWPPVSFPPLFTRFCSAPGPTRVLLGSQSEAGSTCHRQLLPPRGGMGNGGCRSTRSPLRYACVVPGSAAPGLCPEWDTCALGEQPQGLEGTRISGCYGLSRIAPSPQFFVEALTPSPLECNYLEIGSKQM